MPHGRPWKAGWAERQGEEWVSAGGPLPEGQQV